MKVKDVMKMLSRMKPESNLVVDVDGEWRSVEEVYVSEETDGNELYDVTILVVAESNCHVVEY